MDWRSIGTSFVPSLEEKPSYTSAQPLPLLTEKGNDKPPKYSRWQYVVGVASEDQSVLLQKLEESKEGSVRGDSRHTQPLAILDTTTRKTRYYDSPSCMSDGNGIIKERTKSYKELTLDPTVTPLLDAWLRYIRAKAGELVLKLQNNKAGVPESMLTRLTITQELEVAAQNCELLHKLSGIVKVTGNLEWCGVKDSAAVAYMFIAILFYKKMLVPTFDEVLDAIKWIKTWSNDYLRVDQLRHELTTHMHRLVSTEPVYWEYMSGTVIQAPMEHSRFLKVASVFFNHLTRMADMDIAPRDNIEKSMVVLLTECFIPRLLASGYHDVAVNVIRHWLAYNMLGNNSCDVFANISKHDLLHSLSIVQRQSNVDKIALMDLCEAVDAFLKESNQSQRVELGYLKPLDYCQVGPVDVVQLPIKVFKLSKQNSNELLFRILELFGSESVDRLPSDSRWYNFVKSTVVNTFCARMFRALVLLHAVVVTPEVKILSCLLMRACQRKEISKKILQLNIKDPDLWATYAATTTDVAESQIVYKEAVGVFPSHVPLLVEWLMFCLEHDSERVNEALISLRKELDGIRGTQASTSADNHAHCDVLDAITPSRACGAALVWLLVNRHRLHEQRYITDWRAMVYGLREYEVWVVLRALCLCAPPKLAQQLAEPIVRTYRNNETITALYVEHCIARVDKPAIRRLVSDYLMRPFVSMATRHIAHFTNCSRGKNFDGGIRLMLLSRVDLSGNVLRSIVEEPMPFKLPSVRILLHALKNTARTCDTVQLVAKHCSFSKALWLILAEHLPASSNIIEEDMRANGIKL
ncbi:primosome assembly protein, putative [Babesia ovata]|uniref:Primosome assembly protein, putative n=1 Tax=Babesia ovata TaxID=189622 RepID=A0A2H6KEH9_9APIC|nr:primosome assembly protein, putative [Babesia ovata]GBE61401.1 primosome assembly protein, putative [Babesia ovata]